MWALFGCLIATAVVLSLAILPSRSSSGFLGATTHSTRNGIACGSVGPPPTRVEVEQFAATQHLSPAETAKLLDCYGFSPRGST